MLKQSFILFALCYLARADVVGNIVKNVNGQQPFLGRNIPKEEAVAKIASDTGTESISPAVIQTAQNCTNRFVTYCHDCRSIVVSSLRQHLRQHGKFEMDDKSMEEEYFSTHPVTILKIFHRCAPVLKHPSTRVYAHLQRLFVIRNTIDVHQLWVIQLWIYFAKRVHNYAQIVDISQMYTTVKRITIALTRGMSFQHPTRVHLTTSLTVTRKDVNALSPLIVPERIISLSRIPLIRDTMLSVAPTVP